jgi:type II secretion system protein G
LLLAGVYCKIKIKDTIQIKYSKRRGQCNEFTSNTVSGFTLIELVVVIAILGILAGIAIPRFMAAQEEARGAKFLADIRTIESAANMYAAKNGTYPGSYDPWYVAGNGNPANKATYTAGSDFAADYFAAWPTPPSGYLRINGNNGKIYRYKLTGSKNGKGDFNPYVWNHSSYKYGKV